MRKIRDLFISAVIVAGGKGKRMNTDINKQYIEIDGIPVLARTLSPFQDCGLVDEIVLVVCKEDIIYCKQNIVDVYGLDKVKIIVSGGAQRQNSVYNGLLGVDKQCDIVLIHDGARPFITVDNITDSIIAAKEHGAAGLAVRVKDTVKTADNKGFITGTVDRERLWFIQTPQTFKYEIIKRAHEKAIEDGFIGTDDAMLVERIGQRVVLVEGSYNNIKITTQEDLVNAETIAHDYLGPVARRD